MLHDLKEKFLIIYFFKKKTSHCIRILVVNFPDYTELIASILSHECRTWVCIFLVQLMLVSMGLEYKG